MLITDTKRIRGNCGNTDKHIQAPLYVIHIYDAHLILHRFILSTLYLCSYHIAIENFIAYIKYIATRSRCHKIKFAISPHFLTQYIYTYSTEHTIFKHTAFYDLPLHRWYDLCIKIVRCYVEYSPFVKQFFLCKKGAIFSRLDLPFRPFSTTVYSYFQGFFILRRQHIYHTFDPLFHSAKPKNFHYSLFILLRLVEGIYLDRLFVKLLCGVYRTIEN